MYFNNSFEWLKWYIRESSAKEVLCKIMLILNSDQVQNLFQEEMNETGYFDKKDSNGKYEFLNPIDWLDWYLEASLYSTIETSLLQLLTLDQIQDLFQKEMVETGYYEEISKD